MTKKQRNTYIAVGAIAVTGVVVVSLLMPKGDNITFKSAGVNNNPNTGGGGGGIVNTGGGGGGGGIVNNAICIYPNPSGYTKSDIQKLQLALNQKYGAGLSVDGCYGPLTRAAVNTRFSSMESAFYMLDLTNSSSSDKGENRGSGFWTGTSGLGGINIHAL